MSWKMIVPDKPTRRFLGELRSLRLKAGLTQKQVSEALNIGYARISEYELGQRYPSLERLIKLAEFLGYDLTESVNYKYFTHKKSPYQLKQKLGRYGLNCFELSHLVKYPVPSVTGTVNNGRNSSVFCFAAILELLNSERKLALFRESLCRERGKHARK